MKNRKPLAIGALVLGGCIATLAVIAVGWWLASPLFIDQTVDEDFPFELPAASEINDMPAEEAEQVVMDAMKTVDEAFVESLSADQATELEDTLMEVASKMPDHEMEDEMPAASAEWVLAAKGIFAGADSFHQGSGTASIFTQGDQSVLRFEDFNVTNGPDLHVLLVENTSGGDMGEYVDLGSLKGNMGNQNYDIPPDVDLSQYSGVMIYCVPFHVEFATAPFDN